MSRPARVVRRAAFALLALAAAWHLGALAYVFARRLGYPLDVEWMEGGTLVHALRLMDGRGIYVAPSVDFIPYLYTPLHPALLAALGQVVGLSYALGRAVSILCFAGAVAIAARAVRREGGAWPLALAACGAAAAAFPLVDGFYDLVRADSLHLLLVAGGLVVLRRRHDSARGVALAAGLLALAWWAKQTAAVFVAGGFVALLAMRWRLAWVYLGVVAIVDGVGGWIANRASDGWFWRVVYEMHQAHDLYWGRVLWKAQWRMAKAAPLLLAAPVLWLALAAVTRRAAKGTLFWAFFALCAAEASALAFATQWAVHNAFMPAYFFGALFLGVAIADVAKRADGRRGGAVACAAVALAATAQLGLLVYRPARWAPDRRQQDAASRFIKRLRQIATRGDVLVPYHPWYAVLAGRPAHFHQMGVNDLAAARMRVPPGIRDAIAAGRFAAVVLDKEPDPRYAGALRRWRRSPLPRRELPPGTWHGFRTRPRFLFEPPDGRPPPRAGKTTPGAGKLSPGAGRGPAGPLRLPALRSLRAPRAAPSER